MITESTGFEGLYILKPNRFEDKRGYFFESFNQKKLLELTGFSNPFVQDNQSRSTYGVLRGMHYQTDQYAQTKLVRVLRGEVLDVVVDIRPRSATFGKAYCLRLSEYNGLQLLIPRGFAHGLLVLSEYADFFYKCDNYYSPSHEAGIHFESIEVDWILGKEKFIVSEKDALLPKFEIVKQNLIL